MATADAQLWEAIKAKNPGASNQDIAKIYQVSKGATIADMGGETKSWEETRKEADKYRNYEGYVGSDPGGKYGGSYSQDYPEPEQVTAYEVQKRASAPTNYHVGGGGGGGGGSGGFNYTIPEVQVETYDPVVAEVGPEQTVNYQLPNILSRDNRYMQQAHTRGLQTAAQRGLLNSSMAVQAAEAARVSAALPMAQQDASTEFSQSIANQNAINTARAVNAGAFNAASLQTQRLAAEQILANIRGQYQIATTQIQGQFGLAGIQAQTSAAALAQYRQLIAQIYSMGGLTPAQQENMVNIINRIFGYGGQYANTF